MKDYSKNLNRKLTRRSFLWTLLSGSTAFLLGPPVFRWLRGFNIKSETFVATVTNYQEDIASILRTAFKELGITKTQIRGKRILLKPNLVETHTGAVHINTHPMVIRGAIEAFLHYGASDIIVAEGPGHCRDSYRLLDESGVAEILFEDKIQFIDLNYDDPYKVKNLGKESRLDHLVLPKTLKEVDYIVSMPKLKTHHWVGVTLSMKNLFGVMPGSYYGWPKNVLHLAGINNTIVDINATIRPHLAIVDGIIGMEGDGPIMGSPRQANVVVVGQNFPAVDATCARIMGVDPFKIDYLLKSNGRLGTISASNIHQRGENISAVQSNFKLLSKIPAHDKIRL
jgi:uncharacterized protein (DUF362 family)